MVSWVKSSPEIICATSFDSELIFLLIWHGIRVPFLLRIINLPSASRKYVLMSFVPCPSHNFTYNLQKYAMVRWDIPIKMLSAHKNKNKIEYHIDMIFIWNCACTCMYVWYVCMVCMYGMHVQSTFHVTFNVKVELISINFLSKWEFIGFLKTAEKR